MKSALFKIRPPDGTDIDHRFSKLDQNYVRSGNAIGVAYVFAKPLPVDQLKSSLGELLAEFPALAGRADFKTMTVSSKDAFVPFEYVKGAVGSADDFANPATHIRTRTNFINEPTRRAVERGNSALMTVKLTEFDDGGCVLGVSINHGLVDGAGFHKILRHWSDLMGGQGGEPPFMGRDIYGFSTGRDLAQWQSDLDELGLAQPLNFNTLSGKAVKAAMFSMLDKIRARGREMIHFTPAHVAALKAKVREEAELDWVSTNVALSAHILHAIIPLQLSAKATSLGVGNVINIRGRVDPENRSEQDGFAGNALFISISQIEQDRPIANTSRGEIARSLHGVFTSLDEPYIRRCMENIVDSLDAGYGYPGLNLFSPIMAINNQSKFQVYDVDFGVGSPVRVVPQDVGDHIMFFPAIDGGLEIYLRDFTSLKRQKKLLTAEWQSRLFAI